MAKPPPDLDRVARILVDATAHGVEEAARRHGLHRNTIAAYRRKLNESPELVHKVTSLKRALADSWLLEAQAVRAAMVENLRERAAKSKNLRSVAGAFKILHDAILAEEITTRVRKPRPSPGVGGQVPTDRAPGAGASERVAH